MGKDPERTTGLTGTRVIERQCRFTVVMLGKLHIMSPYCVPPKCYTTHCTYYKSTVDRSSLVVQHVADVPHTDAQLAGSEAAGHRHLQSVRSARLHIRNHLQISDQIPHRARDQGKTPSSDTQLLNTTHHAILQTAPKTV